jgi:hypothetical protein
MEEDKKEFSKNLFKDDTRISCYILDHLMPWEPNQFMKEVKDQCHSLEKLSKVFQLLICDLGWIEHTGDWDPFLQIEFHNKEVFTTESGYYLFDVDKQSCELVIEAPDKEDLDLEDIKNKAYYVEGNWRIPIVQIKSIVLCR